MMRKLALSLLLIAAVLALPAAAFAAPADPAACAQANAAVLVKGVAAVGAAENLAKVQDNLAQALADVKAKQAALDAAQALPLSDLDRTAKIAKATTELASAVTGFKNLVDPVTDIKLTQALTTAQANLAAAVKVQTEQCADVTPPTTTVTPPPTTIVVPPPVIHNQILRIPRGSIATGTA